MSVVTEKVPKLFVTLINVERALNIFDEMFVSTTVKNKKKLCGVTKQYFHEVICANWKLNFTHFHRYVQWFSYISAKYGKKGLAHK